MSKNAQKQDWKDVTPDKGEITPDEEAEQEEGGKPSVDELNQETDIEVKPAITSVNGKKVTKKETLMQFKKNEEIAAEIAAIDPKSKEEKYEVQSNLKMDGENYAEGDIFYSKMSKQIQTLLDIKVIKAL